MRTLNYVRICTYAVALMLIVGKCWALDPLLPVPTTNMDASTDSPAAARVDLFELTTRFNRWDQVPVSAYASLTAAVAAIGSSQKTLVVNSATATTGATVIPATLAVRVDRPGLITNNYTLTINGPFEAGDYQIFSGSGTVTGLKKSRPEWFAPNTTPGTTDMTTAITGAIASIGTAYYGVVELSSYYLISSSISVPAGVTLRGLSSSGTRIYKSAAMTTNGVTLTGFNSQLENISVMTDLGATGDGIQIAAANTVLRNVVVHGAVKTTPSGNGIRIGVDVGPSNCNNWILDNVRVTGMSGHGVYVHDKPGFNPDANAGTAIHVETNDNGVDGIKEDNAWLNTYVGHLSQSNTNGGIHFTGSSKYSSVFGGDREGNLNKEILIDTGAVQVTLSGINITESMTDASITTRRLERQIQKMGTWTPVLAGDGTAGSQTYSVQSGWYFRHGDLVTVQGRIGLSAKDAATAGNMRITGLPFPCATITNGFFPVAFSSWGAFTFPAGFTAIGGNVGSATSYITLNRNGSAQTAAAIAASEIGAAAVLIFSVTYPVAVF